MVYVALGVGAWVALDASGVSPTIAGVVIAFLTPAGAFQRPRHVSIEAHRVADMTVDERIPRTPMPPNGWTSPACRGRPSRRSPEPRRSVALVELRRRSALRARQRRRQLTGHAFAEAASGRLGLGILVEDRRKPLGIAIAVLLTVRWGLGRLPEGIDRGHVLVAGVVAGIPFTGLAVRRGAGAPAPARPAGDGRDHAGGRRDRPARVRPAAPDRWTCGAGAGGRSVAGQLTVDSLYFPGPGRPSRSGRPETRGGRNVLRGVLAQEGGPIAPSSGRSRPTRCG